MSDFRRLRLSPRWWCAMRVSRWRDIIMMPIKIICCLIIADVIHFDAFILPIDFRCWLFVSLFCRRLYAAIRPPSFDDDDDADAFWCGGVLRDTMMFAALRCLVWSDDAEMMMRRMIRAQRRLCAMSLFRYSCPPRFFFHCCLFWCWCRFFFSPHYYYDILRDYFEMFYDYCYAFDDARCLCCWRCSRWPDAAMPDAADVDAVAWCYDAVLWWFRYLFYTMLIFSALSYCSLSSLSFSLFFDAVFYYAFDAYVLITTPISIIFAIRFMMLSMLICLLLMSLMPPESPDAWYLLFILSRRLLRRWCAHFIIIAAVSMPCLTIIDIDDAAWCRFIRYLLMPRAAAYD